MATDRHQAPSYPLRMPTDLKARVQAAAEESGRSLHAELLMRIEDSFALKQKVDHFMLHGGTALGMLEAARHELDEKNLELQALALKVSELEAKGSSETHGGGDGGVTERYLQAQVTSLSFKLKAADELIESLKGQRELTDRMLAIHMNAMEQMFEALTEDQKRHPGVRVSKALIDSLYVRDGFKMAQILYDVTPEEDEFRRKLDTYRQPHTRPISAEVDSQIARATSEAKTPPEH